MLVCPCRILRDDDLCVALLSVTRVVCAGRRPDIFVHSKMGGEINSPLGERPKCFKNNTQEVLFIFVATMATGMGSLVAGAVTVLSGFVGRDLNMSIVEISWISASSG